jgi:hypothetical protein
MVQGRTRDVQGQTWIVQQGSAHVRRRFSSRLGRGNLDVEKALTMYRNLVVGM